MNLINLKKIGIIGAMPEEVSLLIEKMQEKQHLKLAGRDFYQGVLQGRHVVVVCAGIGKVNAGMCTQILIDRFEIECIINSGVAGAVDPHLAQGDIVISSDLVQHDVDTSALGDPLGMVSTINKISFAADSFLIALAEKSSQKIPHMKAHLGRIASGDQFIAGGDRMAYIAQHFSPLAVEMEGAAIAQVAYLNELPFVIIRAISDKADGDAPLSYPDFLTLAAKRSSSLILEMLKGLAA